MSSPTISQCGPPGTYLTNEQVLETIRRACPISTSSALPSAPSRARASCTSSCRQPRRPRITSTSPPRWRTSRRLRARLRSLSSAKCARSSCAPLAIRTRITSGGRVAKRRRNPRNTFPARRDEPHVRPAVGDRVAERLRLADADLSPPRRRRRKRRKRNLPGILNRATRE